MMGLFPSQILKHSKYNINQYYTGERVDEIVEQNSPQSRTFYTFDLIYNKYSISDWWKLRLLFHKFWHEVVLGVKGN